MREYANTHIDTCTDAREGVYEYGTECYLKFIEFIVKVLYFKNLIPK